MGFLKKLFKPVSKVLDKIVPNEIKPLLPYAAAFAPYMLPAGMTFGATSGILSNPMISRALASGGANLFSQLAQEGNEGDVNLMSTGIASLQGAMGAKGAADKFRSYKNPTAISRAGGNMPGQGYGGFDKTNLSFLDKAKNFGLEGLAKGSEFVGEAGSILRPGETPLTMKNVITAAGIPFSMGTGEAMKYEADAAMEAYKLALADYDAEQAALGGGTDEGRRDAILAAMKAYNHPTELIESTLAELGLRNGGRVGYAGGGGITDIFAETSFVKPDFGGVEQAIGNVEEKNELLASRQSDFYMLLEEAMNAGDQDKILEIQSDFYKEFGIPMPMSENITEESVTQMAAQGGIMGYNMGGGIMDTPETDFISMDEVVENVNEDQLMVGMGSVMKLFETPYGFDRERFEEMIIQFKEHQDAGGGLGINNFAENFLGMVKKDTPNAPMKMAQGGMMSVLPQGMEMDYRGGGFIPMGSKERADDVPARVSKNEFVMTADAVRAAGGGSVNKGAQRMYDLMNNLEARA